MRSVKVDFCCCYCGKRCGTKLTGDRVVKTPFLSLFWTFAPCNYIVTTHYTKNDTATKSFKSKEKKNDALIHFLTKHIFHY